MRMKRWIWFLLLLFPLGAEAAEVGDYVNLGSFREEPVSFYICGKKDCNGDGILDYQLFSSGVIAYKEFDSDSGIWKDSALRSWLNSSDPAVDEDGDPGFLSGFSEQEKQRLLTVSNQSMYPKPDGADGGQEAWRWNDGNNRDWRLAVQNYENAYYQLSDDRVFLPSVWDLSKMQKPLLFVPAAATAGENPTGTKYGFFFRDAAWGREDAVRYFYEYNGVSLYPANRKMGIRPMLALDGRTILSGSGDQNAPFYVVGKEHPAMKIKNCQSVVGDTKTTYTARIKNYAEQDRSVSLAAAVYENGRLKKTYRSEKTILHARSKQLSVEVPREESGEVRLYYWDETLSPIPVYERAESEVHELSYQNDFQFLDDNITISTQYGIKNAFDGDAKTLFAMSNLEADDIVFHFKNLTTLKKISLQSVQNGDWAMAKTVALYAYNDENLYRNNTKNPVYAATVDLSKNNSMQEFILPENETLTEMTHLVLRITDTYRFSSGAVWGGFSEIRLYGSAAENEPSVSDTVDAKLLGNRELAHLFGIDLPDGTISRQDAANALQKIGVESDGGTAEPISGETFYSMFTDPNRFLKSGIGMLWGKTELSGRDLGTGLLEALRIRAVPESLPEIGREHLEDKIDTLTAAHIGETTVSSGMVNGTFSFTRLSKPKVLQPTNFCYNAPFHYAGIYYGVMPETEDGSKRQEFSRGLADAGAKSLRFPGGLACHQYFLEGEQKTAELYQKAKSGFGGGLYNTDDPNSRYYTDFYEFLDFCRKNEIEPIFQVNTSFYVDPDAGTIHAICPNVYAKNTDLYDYDRYTEAAAALEKNIDQMLSRGYTVKYWELGNEDFYTLNVQKTALSDPDNTAEKNYAKLTEPMIRVIKEKIPDAVIIATGGFPSLDQLYREDGILEDVDYVSAHYPFAYWITPTAADKDNLTTLLEKNEMGFFKNAGHPAEYDPGESYQRCTTETSVWRFESWDAGVMQNTFAMALNTAHQWGELLFETPWKISTLHDLESPFFGFMLYGMKFNPQNRWFVYANTTLRTAEEDIPEDYQFLDQYHLTPAARAVKLLSNHCGGSVLKPDQSAEFCQVAVFCSERDSKITVTAVNKLSEKKEVELCFSNLTLPHQTVRAEVLKTKNLGAILDREYQREQTELSISSGSSLRFTAEPYSIYQFILTE